MKDFSYITNQHPSYIESLYKEFVINPEATDPDLKKFFEGFDFAVSNVSTPVNGQKSVAGEKSSASSVDWSKEIGVYRLITKYRSKGHLIAKTNPIRERIDRGADLDLKHFGLS